MAVNNPRPILRVHAAVNEYATIGVGYPYAAGTNYWQIGHILFDDGGDGEIHGDMIIADTLDFAETDPELRLPIVLPESNGATGEEVRFAFYYEEHALTGASNPDDDEDGTGTGTFAGLEEVDTDVAAWVQKRLYRIDIPIDDWGLDGGKYYKWALRREMGVVTTDHANPVLIRHPYLYFKA